MKLRIRGDTLRLRLTRREVAELGAGRSVEDAIAFGPAEELRYVVSCADGASAPRARFDGRAVEVSLPRELARRWAEGEQVGIEAEQPNGRGALKLLVEKDFACLSPREGEDDTDAFPHP